MASGLKVTRLVLDPTPTLTLPLNVAAVADEAPPVKLLNSIVDPAAVVNVAGSPSIESAEIVPPAATESVPPSNRMAPAATFPPAPTESVPPATFTSPAD